MEMPADIEQKFERLYKEIDLRLLQARDGRPMPEAWIDRFKLVCEAQGYTNVQGLHYADFRAAFYAHYNKDYEWVSSQVEKILGENPTGKFDPKLLSKFAHL